MLDPAPHTHGLGRVALGLLVTGAAALAFAAYGLASVDTPGEELGDGATAGEAQDALDRFRVRLDLYARLLGSGLGLLAAGVACLAAAYRRTGRGARWVPLTAALGAAFVLVAARWQSVDAAQFAPAWDHWLLAEALAWTTWGAAVAWLVLHDGARPERPD